MLQEAVRLLRARGRRRPELAGKDLERMMQELVLRRSFGPERMRKYRERLEAQGEDEEILTEKISTATLSNATRSKEGN